MRELATVQIVKEILPIPERDRIGLAIFEDIGWRIIVRKDQVSPGDKMVVIECDSIIPDKETYKFLDKKLPRTLKTMKLSGVISQGLAIPVKDYEVEIPWITGIPPKNNVTELLEITKYEPPDQGTRGGNTVRTFPTHILPRTDETRVQSKPRLIQELRGKPYYITTKLDGASYTSFWLEENYHVCTHNNEIAWGENWWWKASYNQEIEEKLKYHPDMALQGEVNGPGIQNNRMKIDKYTVFGFQVWNIAKQRYLDYSDMLYFFGDTKLPMVPVVEAGESFNYTMEELEKLAITGCELYPEIWKEGIVVRPQVETYSQTLQDRLSMKVISTAYELEYGS